MTETTIGREPVQIVEIQQPLCANTFGTAPCTASGTGDTKCYNTRASCQDAANYRISPAGHLNADLVYEQGDTIPGPALDATARGADLFFAVKASFPSDASGVLWEHGGSGVGIYIGIDTSGNIVFRAGDGSTLNPASAAKIVTPATAVYGKTLVLFGEVDLSANKVTLWLWDERLRELTQLDTDTAASAFSTWSGGDSGGVGKISSSSTTGENTADFNGTIDYLKIYLQTSAPDMTASFKQPLYFSRGNVADRGVPGVPYLIPSLVSVSTAPTVINLAASNPDAKGLGTRALATIQFKDHPHTDRVVDPYLDGRTFSPMQRGSFWSKWLVRNLYRTNIMVKVYEGYAGQALSAMTVRRYFITGVNGPDDAGNVTIRAQDILARVEERKATAPQKSPGELYSDIEADDLEIGIANGTLSDYPSSGTVRIDEELIKYSSIGETDNGVAISVSERGAYGTTADTHEAESSVQRCVVWEDVRVEKIVRDLLVDWAGIDEGYLDYGNWQSESLTHLPQYRLSTVVTEPEAVIDLLSELQEQCSFYIWWDERDALIKFKAIRGLGSEPDAITAESNILPGFSIAEMPRQRVSQVWFYYQMRDYTQSLEEPVNYSRATVDADLDAESEEEYGEPSIRKIFSRWISTAALANTTASKIRNRYVETPRVAAFEMDAKDRTYWTGANVAIQHYLDVDEFGQQRTRYWTIISAEEVLPGERVRYKAEDTTLYGSVSYILAAGAADYPGAGSYVFGDAYIGDADGFLSDGEECARIG